MTGANFSSPPETGHVARAHERARARVYIDAPASALRARCVARARSGESCKSNTLEEGTMRVPRSTKRDKQEPHHEKMACGCQLGGSILGYRSGHRADLGTCACCGRPEQRVLKGWWPAKGDERRHNKPKGIHLVVCADCMRGAHADRVWELTYGKNH